jgi:hypothetical protein
MRPIALVACAAAVLALGACKPKPEGSKIAASMPDTTAPRAPDTNMTAPDAGATGAAEPVPAEGGAGNVAGATVPNPEASNQP